jgi:hypothetical protein
MMAMLFFSRPWRSLFMNKLPCSLVSSFQDDI